MGSRFYLCLSPWLVFAVVDRSNGQGTMWAALAALAFTVAIVLWPSGATSFTFANGGAMTVFAALAAGAAIAGGHGILQTYGRLCAASGLALTALASLTGKPFTTPYMDAQVLPDEVSTARFRQANIAMTAAWAAAAAATALSFLLAVDIPAGAAATVFNWIIPGALVAFTVRATVRRWEADFDPDERIGGLHGLLGALDTVPGFEDPA